MRKERAPMGRLYLSVIAGLSALAAIPAWAQEAPPPYWNSTGQQALETGKSGTALPWKNPDGSSGSVTPFPAFQTADGQVCREFQETVTIAGRLQQAYGTACRQPDGSWKLQPAAEAAAINSAPPPPAAASVPPPPAVAYAPPPTVVYALPPAYYYPAPYYSSVRIGVGFGCCGHDHYHHHHW
jgi:hypothetical protein